MPNLNIDIALPPDVQQYLAQPDCATLQIPTPEKLTVCLPFGGSMQGIVDVTKAIPDDCSLTFSLLLQLPPLMASLGCFIKLLKLIQPLTDFFKAVPNPIKMASAIAEILPAAADIVECFTGMMIGIPLFVRDILNLIAKLLSCIAQTIKSIADLMSGIEISIAAAKANNNTELLAQLQCAQANAQAQADAALGSMDMIAAVLAIAEPLLGIAGVSFSMPTLGSPQDAQALTTAADTMLQIATTLKQIAQSLPQGGC
ncbi:MAG TPA: hypothetical protein VIA18_07360 [Polyangia bacterium]|jgi:hypothetical protein|nr:hypothetical protein [Polyangia bacterium]